MAITLGVVEVPAPQMGAQPLAARRFADTSLLEWVVRRVSESLLVERVLVMADAAQRAALSRLVPPNAFLFDGPQKDVLSSFAAAARSADATSIVRVPIDCPFVDPNLIDRLICDANAHPGCDYIGYISNSKTLPIHSRLGMFGEWIRADALLRAARAATEEQDRAACARYIQSHPEHFQLRLLPVPASIDRDDIRLAVKDEEDWEHAQLIFDALGPDQLDCNRIADLLAGQPALRLRMAALNQAAQASRA